MNKSWYIWNGSVWLKDESGEISRRAKQTVKAMLHEAADLQGEEERKLLVSHEQRCESEGRLNAMVLAKSRSSILVGFALRCWILMRILAAMLRL